MRFVARQPVFDSAMQVYGYELLFRNGWHNAARINDADGASRITADISLELGVDILCAGKRAFLNCTRDLLLSRAVETFAPHDTVLEILEDIEPDAEILQRCDELRRLGYTIALDDVVSMSRIDAFFGHAAMAKVDFRATTKPRRAELVTRCRPQGITMLAEKVETREEHLAAQTAGYSLFQGFFFQKPQVLGSREIPALKINYTRLLAAAQQPELDFAQVEDIIKSEPSLCYRFLRYLNSPIFPFRTRINSVRHALTLVGEDEVRKWISVAALVSVGVDKPPDLVVWALARARFCELIGMRSPARSPGMFFLGLVSALPVLLDLPLDFIISRLPVLPEIQTALLGGRNHYRQAYDLLVNYELGKWEVCGTLAKGMAMTETQVAQCYVDSLDWAHRLADSEHPTTPLPARVSQSSTIHA
jgi:c-di-GMP-related signal transduction protein